jgi:hypothetical protein
VLAFLYGAAQDIGLDTRLLNAKDWQDAMNDEAEGAADKCL